MIRFAFVLLFAFPAFADTFNGVTSTGSTSCPSYSSSSVGLLLCKSGDSGLMLVRTDTGSTNDEGFLAMAAKDSSGGLHKVMSLSSMWKNPAAAYGYSANRFNAVYNNGSTDVDDLSIVQFGGKGVTMLSGSNATNDEPQLVGDGQTRLLIRGNTGVYQSVNGRSYGLTSVNSSTGTSASNRTRFGNSVSDNAFTIDVYGYYHASKANYAEVFTQFNAPLLFGTEGNYRGGFWPVSGGAAFLVGTTDTTGAAAGDIKTSGAVIVGGFTIFNDGGTLKVKLPGGTVKTIVLQ